MRSHLLAVLAGIGVGAVVLGFAAPAQALTFTTVPSASAYGSVSSDGGSVAFTTKSKLVPGDTNSLSDLYARDAATGTVQLVSASASGVAVGVNELLTAGAMKTGALVSDSLGWATFVSSGAVVPGISGGVDHVYLKNLSTGAVELADRLSSGAAPTAAVSKLGGISADGNRVVFVTSASLQSTDTNTYGDAYVYERSSASTILISTVTGGSAAAGSASTAAISANGAYVAYSAIDGSHWGIFRKEVSTGTVLDVAQATPAATADPSQISISRSGQFVGFVGMRSFDSGDTNGKYDVYLLNAASGTRTWLSKPTAVSQPSTPRWVLGTIAETTERLAFGSTAKLSANAASGSTAMTAYLAPFNGAAPDVVAPDSGLSGTYLGYTLSVSNAGSLLALDASFGLRTTNP